METSIKTIIVDDVALARERIKMLLAADSEIKLIAECANGREAVKSINELKPDLVFLDVQMPEINGFEVIENIGIEKMPTVIFVTAHDHFALRAFETNAVDYLLKPFDNERLNKAVEKAKREIRRLIPAAEIEMRLRKLLVEVKAEPQYVKRIPVKSASGTCLVLVEDIDFVAAAGHYLELCAKNKKHLIRESMTQLERKLDPARFVRIHRSIIINIDRIKTIHPMFNGDQLIILQDGTELSASRTYYEKLFSLLSK